MTRAPLFLSKNVHVMFQFGDEHPAEIEDLWAALVRWWPANLKVVIRYLLVLVNMAATDLLPYVRGFFLVLDITAFTVCHNMTQQTAWPLLTWQTLT